MIKVKSGLILSYTFLLFFSTVHSQNVVPGSDYMLDKLRLNKVMDGIEYETYETVVGDPFIYKDFHEGDLTLQNGEVYKLNMRYDIYGNQVHIKNKDQIFGIIYPEKVASIVIDTIKLLYFNYVNSPGDKSKAESTYFILKTDGKCSLLIKKNIRIQDAELPKVLQDAKPAKFIHTSDTYYLKVEGKSAFRINSKKDLLNILADRKDELSKFIDSNKLGTKDLDDLVKIVTFYNSL